MPALPLVSPLPMGRRARRYGAASPDLLAAAGYVEEEYFLTGTGELYTYDAADQLEVKAERLPYTTQLLIRRPADPARFSGTTILEPMHRAGPWGMTYGTCWDAFVANGDAWAQIIPGRFHVLNGPLILDAGRYAPLNLSDEGQVWDMLAQTGALLKSDAPENPLPGTRHLYMTGTSGTALIVLTYLGDGFHERHRLDDGRPIYDGYLPYAAHGSLTYFRICSPPRGINGAGELTPHPSEQIPMDDPRRTVRGHDVPVIQAMTESEVIIPFATPPVQDLMINMYNNGLPVEERLRYRREDSDDPADLYRLYEIAGAGHDASLAETTERVLGLAKRPMMRMGRPRAPLSDFPVKHSLAAAFAALHRWAADGVAPARADRIAVDDATVTLVRDECGNAVGGVRTPYVDVPLSRYTGVNPGAALMGSEEKFDVARARALYGDHAGYVARVQASATALAADGWLREPDAQVIVDEARAAADRFDG
jgi:hypothetical protein